MTIKELINKLQEFDPDLEVMCYDEYRYVNIDTVKLTSDKFYNWDTKKVTTKTFIGIY